MAPPTPTEKEDAALSLTVAVVGSSNGPLLLLDEDLNVVVASGSFCRAFAVDPKTVVGKSVLELGGGEWSVPQLRSLLMATAAGDPPIEAYEFDLRRQGRRFADCRSTPSGSPISIWPRFDFSSR
jgi:PAS domain-containing protein